MQDALFPGDPDDELPTPLALDKITLKAKANSSRVAPQPPDPAHMQLASTLPVRARLGTSSWNYPGWAGLVWDGDYIDIQLSKHGLAAYAQHPLHRSVSLDRAFYRPLTASQYSAYAAQVGDDFRFVVKGPALVTDATVRGEKGQAVQPNPAFLSAELAVQEFAQPALQGLGTKLGVLVFQISPLPAALHSRMPELLRKLAAMLQALPSLAVLAPDAVIAVEVRDPIWLTPEFASVLRQSGATYCLGVHAKMPPIEGQLPLLRALWPEPLVCRWNLHRMHGAYGYEDAAERYQPYARLVDVDLETRALLAKVVNATTRAGYNAYVTVSNKAEGCAPLSVVGLAQEITRQQGLAGKIQAE
ncbi:MAG: DUF72 domain-containing protein [Polaromonas sp.]|nr:DUF72 domain-containing protein [Polaromonas sp.]